MNLAYYLIWSPQKRKRLSKLFFSLSDALMKSHKAVCISTQDRFDCWVPYDPWHYFELCSDWHKDLRTCSSRSALGTQWWKSGYKIFDALSLLYVSECTSAIIFLFIAHLNCLPHIGFAGTSESSERSWKVLITERQPKMRHRPPQWNMRKIDTDCDVPICYPVYQRHD